MIYFNLRRDLEAEQCCQQLIHEHRDRAIGYVTLSDGLSHPKAGRDPAKVQRAISVLKQALAYPVKDADDFDVVARLRELRSIPKSVQP